MEKQERKLIAQTECRRLHSVGVDKEICQEIYRRLMRSTDFRFDYSLRKLRKVQKNCGKGFKIMKTRTAHGTGIDEITIFNGKTIFWVQNEREEQDIKEELSDIMDNDISPAAVNIYD